MLLCLRGLSCVFFFHLDLNYWMFGGKLQSLAFLACDPPLVPVQAVFSRLCQLQLCRWNGRHRDLWLLSYWNEEASLCKYMLLFHFIINIPSYLPHFSLKFWWATGHPCIAALFIQLNYNSPSLICPLVTAIFLFFNHPASSSFFPLGHAVLSGLPHFLCIIDCMCLPVPFIPSVPLFFPSALLLFHPLPLFTSHLCFTLSPYLSLWAHSSSSFPLSFHPG